MRYPMIPSFAALALALGASPALAGETVTLRVAVGDLDLADEDDLAKLKARIAEAASEACEVADEWTISDGTAAACESTLKRKALAELESRIAELS